MGEFVTSLLFAVSVLAARASGQGHQENSALYEFLTYNPALPYNVPEAVFYDVRRSAFMNSIHSEDPKNPWQTADVVCLQEIGELADRADVVSRARKVGLQYNYTFGQLEAQLTGPACPIRDVAAATTCLTTNCPTAASNREIIVCLLTMCESVVATLKQHCINCVLANTDRGTVTDILYNPTDGCTLPNTAVKYPSHLNLMLLSRKAILSASLVPFRSTSQIIRRGYIRAEIADIGTVYCAHANPDLESVNSSSFTAAQAVKNRFDVETLVNASRGTNAIIIGDLNTGPSNTAQGVAPLFPQSYDYAVSQGLTSPYTNASGGGDGVGQCTFCVSNPIIAGQVSMGVTYRNQTLDHVMVDTTRYYVNHSYTARFFTDNSVTLPAQGERSSALLPVSDHYAVRVALRLKNSASPALSVTSGLVWMCTAAMATWAMMT